jgi:hypothetical protein
MKRPASSATLTTFAALLLVASAGTAAAQGVATPTRPSKSTAPAKATPGAAPSTAPGTASDSVTMPVKLPTAYPPEFTAGKVELRDPDGTEILSFKPRPPASLTVRDARNMETGRFALSDGRLKATGPDGKARFELKRKDDKVMLKDADGEKELFKFKLKGRDIDFYGPGDKLLWRLRHKDYGYALEDAAERTLFRAKVKDEKRVLRDPADKTVLYSKELSQPLGLIFFRIPQLDPLQQAACCVFFQQKL